MRNPHLPYWLFAVAYGAAFMLPVLVAEGTFMDGEIYSVLARNYAIGQGSLWSPHFSLTVHDEWHEHPPAGLWFMSLAYRILGDHPLVEHAYSLLTALLCGALIIAVWRRLFRDEPELRSLGWLPVLLWLMNPQVTWSYSNAMLENTMTVFVLLAFRLLLETMDRPRFPWAWTLAAGGAVLMAILAKGPAGLFPLATVALAWVSRRRPGFSRALGVTLLVTAVVVAGVGLLWLWPAARHGLTRYLETQLVPSLSGGRGGSPNLPGFLEDMLNTHLPALGLVLVLLGIAWRRGLLGNLDGGHRGRAVFLLLLGLAGSMPVGFSPRNSLFYCVPSFPFYALGLAALAAPVTAPLLAAVRPGGRAHRICTMATALLLAAVLVFSATRVGTYGRDGTVLPEVKAMRAHLASTTADGQTDGLVLGACQDLWRQYSMYAHFARYGGISLQLSHTPRRFMLIQGECADPGAADYALVPLGTELYQLHEQR